MKKGKFSKRFSPRPRRKLLPLAIVLLLLVTLSVGGTMAYFAFSANPVINTFQTGTMDVRIDEQIAGNQKTSITVNNTGTASVYVRVQLVSYWKDGNNIAPVSSETVSVSLGSNWKYIDGYYYYTKALAGGTATENLLKAPISMGTKDGYAQVIEVLADTVQASPAKAVEDVWGIEASAFIG